MKLDHDLHVHTYLSACCSDPVQQRPAQILALAETMGVGTIGFADHVWMNPDVAPSTWYKPQDAAQVSRLRTDLEMVSSKVRVLVGCEADMTGPGRFSITPAFAETLDFVLLSASHFHMKDFVDQPAGDTPRDLAVHMLTFFKAAVTSGWATSIAHPLLPNGHIDKYDAAVASLADAELLDAFGLAQERGVALEITTGFMPAPDRPQFALETPLRFLALAKQAGCRFTFGTDAHDPLRQQRLPELARIVGALDLAPGDLLDVNGLRAG